MLPERGADTEDVRGVVGDALDEVREGDAELHVGKGHLAHQGSSGGTCHVADAERETGQGEVLRVIQRGEQDAGARQSFNGFGADVSDGKPLTGGVEAEVVTRPGRPRACVVRPPGQVCDDPSAVRALDKDQAPVQSSRDPDLPCVRGTVHLQPAPQLVRCNEQRFQGRLGVGAGLERRVNQA
ncbi:hypothetical protein [Streptomyces sp. ME19-01-6]|uniref:hypothetical protein n=1 Tax=Streptomyces sp. ME19-01-6 TaxID=3028686 RepID=UPI0029A6197D|nr:hypothetical protein [Streptomyces sp. ME19-01-6]MDX3224555.1 hypothetical protein [Streptomyces sp. ME19-01-6]